MVDKQTVRRIVATLFASQSLASLGLVTAITVGTIAAARLSGKPSLAGIPSTLMLLGTAFSAYPAGRLMDRFGRRNGLTLGFLLSVAGGGLAGLALLTGSFLLLLAGFSLMGLGRGATDQARFAAADSVEPVQRARAISRVVLGGTVGAIGGPLLVGPSGRLASLFGLNELAGPFFAAAVLFLAGSLVIFLLLRPDPRQLVPSAFGAPVVTTHLPRMHYSPRSEAEREAPEPVVEPAVTDFPRPGSHRAREGAAVQSVPHPPASGRPPRTFGQIMQLAPARIALAAMILAHLVMITVMVITPLHMDGHRHSLDAVSWVIGAHVFGMYALSTVTGRVADAFGRERTIATGALILAVACLLAPLADTALLLGGALFLLGLGWNFCYISGSTLLSDLLRPGERGRIQGTNDLIVGLTAAAGSLGSGVFFATLGYAMIGLIGVALALGLLLFSSWPGRSRLRQATSGD